MIMQKEKRDEIIETTNMVIRLCLIAGSQLATAYNVGAAFASGLERDCESANVPSPEPLCACGHQRFSHARVVLGDNLFRYGGCDLIGCNCEQYRPANLHEAV